MRRRQHVNPLGLGLSARTAQAPVISGDRAVELEIGCADAQFLFERARREPHCAFIGLDIRHQLIDEVNRRAQRERMPVTALFAHANLQLRELFAPGRVARIYVNFPDPWFKRRHRKRRLLDHDLALAMHRVLAPRGDLLLQTDVWPVALDAMAVLDGLDDLFTNAAGAWSFWRGANPFGARSWRERHCEEAGLPIWRLLYRRAV